jgi:aldehyde dehydrogenase (NAD+)
LIIDSKVSKAVIDNLKAQASKLYTDKPSKSYAPIISAKQLEKIHAHVTDAIKEGAEVICGAEIKDNGSVGYYYAPTILRIKPEMRIARTEVFGPVLSVIELNEKTREATLSKALEIANSTDYGLSSSIYTRDINLAMQAATAFESGLVYINAPTIGAECGGASLFGGWKSTGNGSREGGVTALDTYTQYKTISIDYSGKLQRAQID